MRVLVAIVNTIDNISEWSGKAVSFLIPIICFVMMYEVIGRYGLNAPTVWSFELSFFLCGTAIIVGGAYALRHGSHVNVDIVYARFSPRVRATLDVITAFVFFAFVGVMAWLSVDFAGKSVKYLEHSDSLWAPPVFPFKMMMPLGAWLITLQGFSKFIRDLTFAITGREEIIREEVLAGRGGGE